jgi:dTDP-4-amino-4,6-dideoxygalactose transaminase
LLTHSGTGALEIAAILSNVGPGDEVIMPSFTFAATATAFVLRGATPVFVDIRPDTLNVDERQIAEAVTPHTQAIAVVHYAGLACDMDGIEEIAKRHEVLLIEDAAQAHLSRYQGKSLGTIAPLGCLSFHATKNIIAGEGGALVINDDRLAERAEVVRDKGTDRGRFARGEIERYTWLDLGSSFAPSEITSAFLYAQLERAEAICARRRAIYDLYRAGLQPLAECGHLTIPAASGAETNGHIFWIMLNEERTRARLIAHLANENIQAVFHYVPLHSSPAGRKFGRTVGSMAVTDGAASRLLRLPLHLALSGCDVRRVIDAVSAFFGHCG